MIYLLEDDDSIRNFVAYALNNSGLETRDFAVPSAFWAGVKGQIPSLILLDIMLPEEDGMSVLRKLRARPETKDIPVIMLTAKGTEYDKVIALDSGADDYVTKPFGIMELMARVRAHLRRREPEEVREYRIGELYVCPARHIVLAGGEEVTLTHKEFDLLCLLLSDSGTVFTRDRILSEIWGFRFDGESRTVDVHIRTLRTKLGACGDLIETVRGVGYKIGGGIG
ncbi:MAG: response regulator transcription factor [Ruminococcaceae bacterium]|nr:response regulator transcription factor [Oscillospiraceae bacterium]